MTLNGEVEKMEKRQIRLIKWAISIILPSLLIFGFNQVLISWNLNRLVNGVEKSEETMRLYIQDSRKDAPKPGEANLYWFNHGYDTDYVDLWDQWIRKVVVPVSKKSLVQLKEDEARIENLQLMTFDSGVKQARKEYLGHIRAWKVHLEKLASCEYYSCVLDEYDRSQSSISQTFHASSTEFSRISPLFDLYGIGERIDKIFIE